MKFNRSAVGLLRGQLANGSCHVAQEPGVYRWWFPKEVALRLLSALKGVDNGSIIKEQIDGKECWCLYFGISKDLRQRIKWHIAQHHSASAVRSGFLSTLRKTISALLHQDETASEKAVNDVLDQCYWDWCATPLARRRQADRDKDAGSRLFPAQRTGEQGSGCFHRQTTETVA